MESKNDDDCMIIRRKSRPSNNSRKRPPSLNRPQPQPGICTETTGNFAHKFYCAFCPYFSSNFAEVNQHRISEHGEKVLFHPNPNCVNTDKKPMPTGASRSLLPAVTAISIPPHERIGKLPCEKCKEKHIAALYPCYECNFLTNCLNETKKHITDVHEKESSFLCTFCNVVYNEIPEFEKHILAKHIVNSIDYQGIKLSLQNGPNDEKQTNVHIEKTQWMCPLKKYTCSVDDSCNFKSISLLERIQHEKEHIYKNFWLPYNLHICTVCNYRGTLQAVVSHIISSHESVTEDEIRKNVSLMLFHTGRIWFRCKKCKTLFDSIHTISHHLDLKHRLPGFDPTPNTPQIKAILAEQWHENVEEIINEDWDLGLYESKLFSKVTVSLNDVVKSDFITTCISCYNDDIIINDDDSDVSSLN